MSTIGDALEHEWRQHRHHRCEAADQCEFDPRCPHYTSCRQAEGGYDHTNTTMEAPVTLPIIAAIEDEARTLGHDISAELHNVLTRHLTIGNMLAHAGQFVAGVEQSPIAQALERFALGPAGEATVAKIVADVAGLLQGQPADAPAGDVPPQ